MQKTKWIKHASAIAITAFVVLAILGVFLLKHFFHADEAHPKKMIQQITMVTPPPPPPPPPPEQIKPPEVKEQIKEAETPPDKPQEQQADKSPAPEQDPNASGEGPTIAAGTSGGIGSGLGGGYEQYVRHEINEWIVENAKLKHMDYIAMLTLQVGSDGNIESCDVEILSGDTAAADILKKLLTEKRKLSKSRPLEAASLVKLRIKSVL